MAFPAGAHWRTHHSVMAVVFVIAWTSFALLAPRSRPGRAQGVPTLPGGLAMRVAAMWAAGLRSLTAADPGSALACGNSVACLTSPPPLVVVRGHDLT